MKRKVLIIGIGAGDPDYLTIQAVNALNRASVFFIPNKGAEKGALAQFRRDILARFVKGRTCRTVGFDVPARESGSAGYAAGIAGWRAEVQRVYERLLVEELGEEDCGAFLIWGDPSIYDGTLGIMDAIRAGGKLEIDCEIIPGISSVQALAARHAIALTGIGGAATITTARRLAGDGVPENADSVVVMLDGEMAFRNVDGEFDIHWGAYLGTKDEILVAGRLADVRDEIERRRKAARSQHGWIMDTYLLRRARQPAGE